MILMLEDVVGDVKIRREIDKVINLKRGILDIFFYFFILIFW